MPFVTGGGLPGVGIGVIWIPHYPAVAPTRVAACPVAPKKDSLLCKEVRIRPFMKMAFSSKVKKFRLLAPPCLPYPGVQYVRHSGGGENM